MLLILRLVILDSSGRILTFQTPGDADLDTKNPAIPHSYLRSDLILHRKPCGDEEKMNRWIVLEQLTLEQPPEGKHIFLFVVWLLSLSVLVCSADEILKRTVSQQKKHGAFVSRFRYSKVTSLNVWQLILIQSCAVSLEERSISHKNCTNSQALRWFVWFVTGCVALTNKTYLPGGILGFLNPFIIYLSLFDTIYLTLLEGLIYDLRKPL